MADIRNFHLHQSYIQYVKPVITIQFTHKMNAEKHSWDSRNKLIHLEWKICGKIQDGRRIKFIKLHAAQ